MDSGTWLGIIALGMTVAGNFAILVRMYVKVQEFDLWKSTVERHISDRECHLDPKRDGWRWDGLEKRLERVERKLDTVIELERRSKLKGDSDDA